MLQRTAGLGGLPFSAVLVRYRQWWKRIRLLRREGDRRMRADLQHIPAVAGFGEAGSQPDTKRQIVPITSPPPLCVVLRTLGG